MPRESAPGLGRGTHGLTIWELLVIFINNSTRHAIPFFGSGPRRVFLFLGGVGDASFITG